MSSINKEKFIEGLNQDLAGELGAIIRYNWQASKAFGPQGAELRELFTSEVPDEMGHALFLMDVIVDLGGEPTTEPLAFDKPDTLRGMLELDLEMELKDVDNYTERAKQAEGLENTELKVRLEEIAADEGKHARELRRILKGM
ncbi:MAG: ferritin-like domain-containing protein [Anaerolineales bacterium]|nr:ferritin-like domain-containing protein [Anaerolineales bacterium]